MNLSRLAVLAVVSLSVAACSKPSPSDPSPAAPVGTAAAAQSGQPVCAVFPRTDVMILSSNPTKNEDALQGVRFFTGVTDGGQPGYTLLRFDVSAIPTEAQVAS